MAKVKYKITNTTRKPPNIDPVTGKDRRKVIEKVGHNVMFKDEEKNPILLTPTTAPALIGELNHGIIRMFKEGLISIEEVEDVTVLLKQHALQKKEAAEAKPARVPQKVAPDLGVEVAKTQPQPVEPKKAKAVEMGRDQHGEDVAETGEYPGAVNPDGPPNFAVTAPKGGRQGAAPNRRSKATNTSKKSEVPAGVAKPQGAGRQVAQGASS